MGANSVTKLYLHPDANSVGLRYAICSHSDTNIISTILIIPEKIAQQILSHSNENILQLSTECCMNQSIHEICSRILNHQTITD